MEIYITIDNFLHPSDIQWLLLFHIFYERNIIVDDSLYMVFPATKPEFSSGTFQPTMVDFRRALGDENLKNCDELDKYWSILDSNGKLIPSELGH